MNPQNIEAGREVLRKVTIVSIGDDCMNGYPDYAHRFLRAAELGYNEVTGISGTDTMEDVLEYFNVVPDPGRGLGKSIVTDLYKMGQAFGRAIIDGEPVRYVEKTPDGQHIQRVFGGI